MFRVLHAIVLTALIALPHDMCFCELIHATFAEHTDSHNDDSAPDEHECSCKLLDTMTAPPTEIRDGVAQADMLLSADVPFACQIVCARVASINSMPIFSSSPLIPCALRI
jgi:hypothetical protein